MDGSAKITLTSLANMTTVEGQEIGVRSQSAIRTRIPYVHCGLGQGPDIVSY
jgi:hypothetical protein